MASNSHDCCLWSTLHAHVDTFLPPWRHISSETTIEITITIQSWLTCVQSLSILYNCDQLESHTWRQHGSQTGPCISEKAVSLIQIGPHASLSCSWGHMYQPLFSLFPLLGPGVSWLPCWVVEPPSSEWFDPFAQHLPGSALWCSTFLICSDECMSWHHSCCTSWGKYLGTLKGKPPSSDPCGWQSCSLFLYNHDWDMYNCVWYIDNRDHSAKLAISWEWDLPLELLFFASPFCSTWLVVHFSKSHVFLLFFGSFDQKKQNFKKSSFVYKMVAGSDITRWQAVQNKFTK